jgi:hypothetical protein
MLWKADPDPLYLELSECLPVFDETEFLPFYSVEQMLLQTNYIPG